jgi:uncharacterized protein YukE
MINPTLLSAVIDAINAEQFNLATKELKEQVDAYLQNWAGKINQDFTDFNYSSRVIAHLNTVLHDLEQLEEQ